MADHVVDGGFSPPADRNRLRAERDKAQQLLRELLEAFDEHQSEMSHGPTANMGYADFLLYKTAQRIREELGDGAV